MHNLDDELKNEAPAQTEDKKKDSIESAFKTALDKAPNKVTLEDFEKEKPIKDISSKIAISHEFSKKLDKI